MIRTPALAVSLLALAACGGSTPPPSAQTEPVVVPVQPPAPAASASATPPSAGSTTSSGGAPTSSPQPTASTSGTVMIGGQKSCNQDTDCEVVELGCCDHCNGGKVDAFNVMVAQNHRPTCKATACTKRGCAPAVAVCTKGVCSIAPP